MSLSPDQVQQGVRELTSLLDRGRLSAVDLTCQGVFAGGCRPPEILLIAAKVAIAIGQHAVARRYLAEIQSCSPELPGLSQEFAELNRLEARPLPRSGVRTTERFHLIKPWRFGVGYDLDHTSQRLARRNRRRGGTDGALPKESFAPRLGVVASAGTPTIAQFSPIA